MPDMLNRSVVGAPVVVVGTGPVGVRFVQQLHERDPSRPIVIYGREAWQPYDRVQLSAFLRGLTDWDALTRGLDLPVAPHIEVRLHTEVLQIDRAGQCVRDSLGRWQPYDTLVLALGSSARVPDLPGVGQSGVFAFRDLSDAQALQARRARSVHTVVLGGGLLGLEAARAMQRLHTRVTVIEHAPRLMARQLDDATAGALAQRLNDMGIEVRTATAVKTITGHGRVTGVQLRDGERIDCDTVIVATGIVPQVRLALDAQLPIGRGIRVDDRMVTADPRVLAIGECAEHRGVVHGLVAPGLEQAGVAVNTLLGGSATYEGRVAPTRLKVAGMQVTAAGVVDAEQHESPLQFVRHQAPGRTLSVALSQGRLVGVAAVGELPQLARLQAAVLARQRLSLWQARRLRRTGCAWPADEGDAVAAWPADARVCQCTGVSRGALGEAIATGCSDVTALCAATKAGTVCGSCRPLLAELLSSAGAAATLPAASWWRSLAVATAAAAMLALVLVLTPGIAYWDSAQSSPAWHRLWTDPQFKQWSGYAVLALAALGLLLTWRKRGRRLSRAGGFDAWRLAHVALGALALAVLAAHTGARLGARLDLALVLAFLGLALVGALSAGVTAWQHRLPPRQLQRWRRGADWAHVLLTWPLPVLLGLHVLKAYWF
ncbi:FAD-dependent oxidoreductase [uncultured Piscinibacter sp.]|uniref:FAD-dependent oxidoreductase n=1 Tax=uncultured Piscinibacter sp. TaxID=1131835 RepID=UPI0026346E90|nr:FAD-dependent oxidoreductase [uncultured Piscinibacter sp.]